MGKAIDLLMKFSCLFAYEILVCTRETKTDRKKGLTEHADALLDIKNINKHVNFSCFGSSRSFVKSY